MIQLQNARFTQMGFEDQLFFIPNFNLVMALLHYELLIQISINSISLYQLICIIFTILACVDNAFVYVANLT